MLPLATFVSPVGEISTGQGSHQVRIPGDADQRSEVMAIAIRSHADHDSDGKPIDFRPFSES
jgi:hypothetical protein